MEKLCTGCLISGKGMRILNEEKTQIYLAQLPEDIRLELMFIKFSFCYRCEAIINKIQQFQRLSTWAMHKLLAYHNTLSLGDLSDRPYFSELVIATTSIIDVPSETNPETVTDHDIFDQTQTDTIKTENDIDIIQNDKNITENDTISNNIKIIENDHDAVDSDYYCEPDSYINDLLVSKLNSYVKKEKKKNASKIKKKTKKKTTKITVKTVKDTTNFDENHHSEPNQDIIPKNDNSTNENDNLTISNNIEIIENNLDAVDSDYYCEPDSYINDLLVSKLNTFVKSDTALPSKSKSNKTVKSPKKKTSEKKKSSSSKKDKNKKISKPKKKTAKNLNIKSKTPTKTRTETLKETTNFDENHHSEPNQDIIPKNDNSTNENDISKKKDTIAKDTIANTDEIKPKIIIITLTKSQINEERKQMSYKTHYLLSHFKCKNCIIGFDSITDYETHFAKYHDEKVGPAVCPVCSRRFPSAELVLRHARTHARRRRCERCGELLASRAAAAEHLREHVHVVCSLCGVRSKSSLLHQVHMKKVHGQKLKCMHCRKEFSSSKTLHYHFKVLHKGQNQHPCPHCGKIYQWRSNLSRHIKNHKAQMAGELYCAPCDKSFSSVATYRLHMNRNKRHATADQYTFSCSDCDKKFLTKRDLADHINWEHLNRTVHVCTKCNKPYKSYMGLYLHMNTHKDASERRNLCHLCGKYYPSAGKLKAHLLAAHSDTMPYACALCGATFNWHTSLLRHAAKLHQLTKAQYNKKKKELDLKALPTPVS